MDQLLIELGMPKIGDNVWVLEVCSCLKERHKCMPPYIKRSTVKEIIPIDEQRKVREGDGAVFTKKRCYKIYERKFNKHHINQFGTRVFRTKEEAIQVANNENK